MKTNSLFAAALLALSTAAASLAQETPAAPAPAAADSVVLETRAFRVPPDFMSRGKADSADPFADGKLITRSAVEVLKSYGVNFEAADSLASFSAHSSRLFVRNTAEQLALVAALVDSMVLATCVQEGLVHLEAFSLPPLAARKALIAHPKEAALYAWLDAEMDKKDSAVRLERHSVTRVRGGQRSKTEGIVEYAYPTEVEPAQVPQTVSLPVAATGTSVPGGEKIFAPWPVTSTIGNAFVVRNFGWTAEMELTFSEEAKAVDLNLAPENSRLAATVPWGLTGEVPQPVIETQRCTAQISMLTGQPALVSTFSPPVNTGVPGGNKDNRVWLLFVTVQLPE